MEKLKITNQNKYLLTQLNKKQIMVNNFIGGLTWSLGAFIGIALLSVFIGLIISKINLVPVIGGWLSDILKEATKGLQNSGK